MILKKFKQQPDERKDYDVDCDWLAPLGDSIDDITLTVECLDDPLDTSLVVTFQNTTSTIKVWVSGGTDGYAYKVTLNVLTVATRQNEAELIFAIGDV